MARLVPSDPGYERDVVLAHHLQMERPRSLSVQISDRRYPLTTSVHMPKHPRAKLQQHPGLSPMAGVKHLQKWLVLPLLLSQHLNLSFNSRSQNHNSHNIKVNTPHQLPQLPPI